ncbi:MAG: triose-phosphate isomerase [Lachnospiraceae bacterium]|nr:triose-phosphate isomerase [Lachnospiraceae bacterium]
MKYIYLNLKRFDIPASMGGVNRLSPISRWGRYIVENTQEKLKCYKEKEVEFVQFYPEAHLIPAIDALDEKSHVKIGCQGIYREDAAIGGNFGAFTTNCPAASAKALGCDYAIIGHCEERNDKAGVLREAGVTDNEAINRILNREIKQALARNMKVLYCIGEKSEEQGDWKNVLRMQLQIGLEGVDTANIVVGYEPIWSIGPGKAPADKEYITKIAQFIKQEKQGIKVVYGGGLKSENAAMLSEIKEIDGGLIALTRFSGDIGFYPDEYIKIIETYLGK